MAAEQEDCVLHVQRLPGRLLYVTLNRPLRLNSWTDRMYAEWGQLLDAASSDEEVAVVVLTGAGRAFSAGQDVAELASYPRGSSGAPSFDGMFASHISFKKPLIAAVNGLAVGWGATMLAGCDLVLASHNARFRFPFTQLGLTAEGGSSYALPRQMRPQDANFYLLSSEWLSAADAERTGLVWRTLPKFSLISEALRIARMLSEKPISSLVATKELISAARQGQMYAAHCREQEAFASGLLGGPANIEALAAMREKREPDFSKL